VYGLWVGQALVAMFENFRCNPQVILPDNFRILSEPTKVTTQHEVIERNENDHDALL
jgi:hypothetical protein